MTDPVLQPKPSADYTWQHAVDNIIENGDWSDANELGALLKRRLSDFFPAATFIDYTTVTTLTPKETPVKYQSKPVTINAVQIPDASSSTIESVLEGAFGVNAVHLTLNGAGDVVMVTTQGRTAAASPGEYIVQEHDDPTRFYPVDPDVFARRYEEVPA